MPGIPEMEVAIAAPLIPISNGKMNSQSSTILTNADSVLMVMEKLGDPSRRIANVPTMLMIMKQKHGLTQNK